MKELASKISPAERKVLEVLWRAGEPLPIAAVREGLESSGWDGSTVKTLLRRLCEKQAVSAEKAGGCSTTGPCSPGRNTRIGPPRSSLSGYTRAAPWTWWPDWCAGSS